LSNSRRRRNLRPRVVGHRETAQLARVVLVERQHQIEAIEIAAHELARRPADGHAPPLGHGPAAPVALFAHVPRAGSRAVEDDGVL
jgi:hypothetical protein